ncbi:MAG: hypothetical protein ABSH19_04280 [Opitutales bacterium]|jgi:hypothetical protein
MSRTSPGKINPILIAFLIPLVVIIAALIFLVVRKTTHESGEQFDYAAYIKAPENFLGNHYNLDAQVESQLAWDEGFGKLLVVRPVNGSGRISVFVPDTLGENLNVGERFHMNIVIKDQGLINVESLEKY